MSFEPIEFRGHLCYTRCDRQQSQAVLDWIRQVSSRTWADIQRTGGKARGTKTGLHWEPRPDGHPRLTDVPTGRTLASMRVNDAFRAWGFRESNVFHVLAFDIDHDLDR